MQVNGITQQNNKKYSIVNARTTGYTAAAGLGLTMASGVIKNKFMRKGHKYFALTTVISTVLHIYLLHKKH